MSELEERILKSIHAEKDIHVKSFSIRNEIEENSKKVVFTFYELRIKMDLTEPTIEKFLRLSETRLINLGYKFL